MNPCFCFFWTVYIKCCCTWCWRIPSWTERSTQYNSPLRIPETKREPTNRRFHSAPDQYYSNIRSGDAGAEWKPSAHIKSAARSCISLGVSLPTTIDLIQVKLGQQTLLPPPVERKQQRFDNFHSFSANVHGMVGNSVKTLAYDMHLKIKMLKSDLSV